VLEGLKENNIENLYIFADDPTSDADKILSEKIESMMTLIESINWCDKQIIYQDTNLKYHQAFIP
jgi:hypothetical protein